MRCYECGREIDQAVQVMHNVYEQTEEMVLVWQCCEDCRIPGSSIIARARAWQARQDDKEKSVMENALSGLTEGRIVHYVLSASDAEEINRRRVAKTYLPEWPQGAQAHTGNHAVEGDLLPMIVCRVWRESAVSVNGQVFLDGNDTFWATSRHEGTKPGTWHWPERDEA